MLTCCQYGQQQSYGFGGTKGYQGEYQHSKEVVKVARIIAKVITKVEAKRVVRPAKAKAKAKERRLLKRKSKAIVVTVKSGAASAPTALHVKSKQDVLIQLIMNGTSTQTLVKNGNRFGTPMIASSG